MATVQIMSSPLGGRLGCMDSSPSRTNLDLPDAFDTSFGSQMSISSNPIGDEFNNSLNNDFQHHHRGSSYNEQNTLRVHSPLGPALGTLLNSKSPGLAAKLASTSNFQFHGHPMDISPSPSFSNGVTVNRPRSSTISSESKSRRDGTATSRRGQGYSESHLPNNFGGFGSNSNLSIADVSMASLSNEGGEGGSHSSGNGGVGLSAMITNSQEFRESASSSINSNTSSNNSGSHPSSSSPPRKSKSKSRSNSNSSSSGGNGRQSVGRNRSSSASLEKSRHHDNHNQNSRGGGSQECPPSAGSTLGRLFGMELSLNDNDDLEEDDENDGLGFEPTLKKRPSSLPLGGGSNPSRPSILGSGILSASSNARSRPTLMQSFTSKPALGGGDRTVRKQASVDSISPNFSSSSYGRPARSRHSSVESVFDAPSQGSHPDLLTRASLGYVPSVHDTIIESPSPAALERKEGLSDYFFDPQSPEHQAPPSQPSRPVSRATSGKRSNSPPNAAGSRRPGPRPSLGIRKLEKAHSSVVLPTRSALNNGGGSTTSSGSGTTRTLGKRSNPYGSGSRNSGSGSSSSTRQSGGATSASQGLLGSGKGNADPIKRLTAPAPRRTQSASDYSATLNTLMHINNSENRSSNLADVSMASSAADSSMDQSPVRKRTMIGNDYPNGFDYGSPVNSSTRGKMFSRPSMLRTSSKDDASPLGYGTGIKRSNSRQNNSGHGEDDSMVGVSINNSPGPIGGGIPSSPFMPGFGASEREGKVLPCFSVSNDGLMRVSTNTVADLLEGKFDQDIDSYQIIDCRFGYEYQGGHIPGAINLNTLEKVKNHFLVPNQGLHYPNLDLPPRSQSGKVDRNGNLKKTVLVFHCEFSAKRAPSMALALRQADRSLNSDYPNCHFPEIYILKGGYCEFFKDFKGKCKPEQYITMDDERFQTKCSNELGAFRKQFERHRSFTYGDTKNNVISNPLLQHGIGGGSKRRNPNLTMTKEDERDVSNSSNSNVEDSPSMAVVGRKTNSLQSGSLNTLGSNFTVNSNGNSSRPSLNSRGFTLGPKISESNSFNSISQSGSNVSMTNGEAGGGGLQDVSFSSSNGDSSFEGLGGPGDYSPCAVASRRPSLMLPPSSNNGNSGRLVMGNNGQQPPQLGRLKLQRAGTTPNFQP